MDWSEHTSTVRVVPMVVALALASGCSASSQC